MFFRMASIIPRFNELSDSEKISTILCPVSGVAAKTANKYIQIICKARNVIDSGEHVSSITFPPQLNSYTCEDLNLSRSSSVSSNSDNASTTRDKSFY